MSYVDNDALVLDLLAELVLGWEDEHGTSHDQETYEFLAPYIGRAGVTWEQIDRHATELHDARFPDSWSRADEPRPIAPRFLGEPTAAVYHVHGYGATGGHYDRGPEWIPEPGATGPRIVGGPQPQGYVPAPETFDL